MHPIGDESSMEQDFIRKLDEVIHNNLSDEHFGVNELSREMGLSKSTLLRKLKMVNYKSVTQYIREVRLQRAMEMLQKNVAPVSEIAYNVGFNSPTYFNTCFHEYYGFPPGEVKKKEPFFLHPDPNYAGKDLQVAEKKEKEKHPHRWILFFLFGIVVLLFLGWLFTAHFLKNTPSASSGRLNNREKSIAVLPFLNLSEDMDNKYFADGVMEDILTNLSHIREFKVISRTSVEQFRDNTLSMPEISKKLGVNYVLEGSVQRYGDKVRVRVQFIDAGNDRHLLSENFDRNLTDIFNIQNEIARQVAGKLQTTLSAEENEQINTVPVRNAEAHNLYLMGRYFWYRRNKADQLKSIEYYNKALAVDPDYALAVAGLADAYYIMTAWRMFPHPEGYIKSKELALKALEVDDNLAEAYATLGAILCWEWKWEEARKELLLALELNPNYATGQFYYSEFLAITGDSAGARVAINKSYELDPWSYTSNYWNALNYYREERYEESVDALWKTLEIFPEMYAPYYMLFLNYNKMKEDVKAIEVFQKYLHRNPKSKEYLNKVKGVYDSSGLKKAVVYVN